MMVFRFGGCSSRWSGESQGHRRQKSRRAALRSRPWVSALESRALLSTLTVTNDNDSGSGSLRGALAAAVAGDSIQFAKSAFGTITLSSGPLEVQTGVKIKGPGAKKVTINGNNTFQDLLVAANVTASVSGLTITGGKGGTGFGYGGGGISNYGTLTVDGCTITSNAAGYDGGGIQNDGTLTITNSVVSNNSSNVGGGILNNTGAILSISGSSISNNSAVSFGGGFENLGIATVTGSVVSNNSAGERWRRHRRLPLLRPSIWRDYHHEQQRQQQLGALQRRGHRGQQLPDDDHGIRVREQLSGQKRQSVH